GSTIRTVGSAITLNAGTNLDLTAGTTTLDTTNVGGTPAGAAVSLASVSGAGFNLTLNAGTGGVVTVGGAATGVGTLTLTNADSFTFSGNVTATTLSMPVAAFDLVFTGGATITNAVNFQN